MTKSKDAPNEIKNWILDLRDMEIGERLSALNHVLKSRNLRPFKALGDLAIDRISVLGITRIFEHNDGFYRDIGLVVQFGVNGPMVEFPVRHNKNGLNCDGAVFAVRVNGTHFAMAEQFRVAAGGILTIEPPRGFSEAIDNIVRFGRDVHALGIDKIPGTLAREMGEEVAKNAQVVRISYLGQLCENSGTHNVWPDFYLVDIVVKDEELSKLQGSEGLKTKLCTWDDLVSARVKTHDLHSAGLYWLIYQYLAANKST